MKTEYSGRIVTVTKPKQKHGRCTFSIGDSGEQDVYCGMVEHPANPLSVLGWIHRQLDVLDSKPVQPLMAAWWYRPGTVEECPSTKGTVRGPHLKPVDGPCTEYWCVREAKIEAQRAKRRTGITAATLSSVLVRGGFTRAELRHDRTAKSEGFSTEGEHRNRRIAVAWRDGQYGTKRLRGELPDIGAFLKAKGYPVRVADAGSYLWVYPKGVSEPSEGQPFTAEDNRTPAHAGGED